MTSQHPNGFSCTFGMQCTEKNILEIRKNHLRKRGTGRSSYMSLLEDKKGFYLSI